MKTNFTNAYDKGKNTFLKRIPPLSTNFLTKQPNQNRRILENVTNNNLKKNNTIGEIGLFSSGKPVKWLKCVMEGQRSNTQRLKRK